jgi:hypothetical protein
MIETKEKVEQLNMLIKKRISLLSELRVKENVANLSHSKEIGFSESFDKILNECKDCDFKIKKIKSELSPKCYLKIEFNDYEYNGSISEEKALTIKKENKIVNWFKNKINEYKYNYAIERALKRDDFIENDITNKISSYNAYSNVIRIKGNKAIFQKSLNNKNIIEKE